MVKDFVDKNQASDIGSYDLAFAYPWKVFNGQGMNSLYLAFLLVLIGILA